MNKKRNYILISVILSAIILILGSLAVIKLPYQKASFLDLPWSMAQRTTTQELRYSSDFVLDQKEKRLHYIWMEHDVNTNNKRQIWTASMNIDGTDWKAVKRTTSVVGKLWPQVVLDSDKNMLHYVWYQFASGGHQIWTASMNTDGTGWNAAQRTTRLARKYDPELVLNPAENKIHYVWYEGDIYTETQIWTASMNIDGTGWKEEQQTTSHTNKHWTQILVDSSTRKIHYAWYENSSNNPSQIWTGSMNTDGTGWSAAQRTTGGRSKARVQFVLDRKHNKFHYMWYEWYKDSNDKYYSQIWTASMNINGAGWKAVQGTNSDELKMYPMMTLDSKNDKIYFFYATYDDDTYNTTQLWIGAVNLDGTGWIEAKRTKKATRKVGLQLLLDSEAGELNYFWYERRAGADVSQLWTGKQKLPIVKDKSDEDEEKEEDNDDVVEPVIDLTTWYFAEGYTGNSGVMSCETWLTIMNPLSEAVSANVTLVDANSTIKELTRELQPQSRDTILVGDYLSGEVAIKVAAGGFVVPERAIYLKRNGELRGVAHASIGTSSESTTWYWPEADTTEGNESYITLANFGLEAAQVTVSFLGVNGVEGLTTKTIPAQSRATVKVNDFIEDRELGFKILADKPIVAEGVLYRNALPAGRQGDGNGYTEGLAGICTPTTSSTWFFAEGRTSYLFSTSLILMNPNDSSETAQVTYVKPDGLPVIKNYPLAGNSRLVVDLSSEDELADSDVAIMVAALGGQGLVAARTMRSADFEKSWAHGTVGVSDLASNWYFAEGTSKENFQVWLTIANFNDADVVVQATYMKPVGESIVKEYSVGAKERFTVDVNAVEGLENTDISIMLQTEGGEGIVAERTMYLDNEQMLAGSNSIGVRQ